MTQRSFAVLFRTHFWDDFARLMADRIYGALRQGDFFILADETRGELDVTPYQKISHTVDFKHLGLDINFPHETKYLWYNGDFPLYQSLVSLPQYDYFCMIEYDAVLNVDIAGLISAMDKNNVEVVAHNLRPAPSNVAERLQAHFGTASILLPCVFIASKRVVEYLYQCRIRVANRYKSAPESGWPFCEGFLGTALAVRADIKFRELSSYGDTSRYDWWPPTLYDGAVIGKPNSFVHPVLDAARYARSRLLRGAEDFFKVGSALRTDLERVDPAVFVPLLHAAFLEMGDQESLSKLGNYTQSISLP